MLYLDKLDTNADNFENILLMLKKYLKNEYNLNIYEEYKKIFKKDLI